MKIFIALAFVLGSFSAQAEDTVKVPVKEGFETLKMEGVSMEQMPAARIRKTTVSMSCRDITGKVINANEPGYETCLHQINTNSASKNNGTPNAGQQMNLNFNTGN